VVGHLLGVQEIIASNLSPETGHPDIFSWFPSVPIGKSRDDYPDVAFMNFAGGMGSLCPVKCNSSWTKGKTLFCAGAGMGI
jgi:hypothetical protein